jgi:TRAP-type uncharacterized transport system fused permease subunit
LAFGAGGWLRHRATVVERTLAVSAGLLLIYPRPLFDAIGVALLTIAVVLHISRKNSAS